MAQSFVQSLTNTFVKGLITEAGPLTFPKDASVDELNMVLLRDGSRARRLGIEWEGGYERSDFTVAGNARVKLGIWENVPGKGNFCVVQNGSDVYFYELGVNAISANRVPTSDADPTPYVLDLTVYESPSSSGAETSEVEFASFNGKLIIASDEIETIYVERSISTGGFTVTEINFEERDFKWLGKEDSDYSEEIATASLYDEREYDTLNAGWVGADTGDAALTAYIAAQTAWPPLTHPFYSGKDSTGAFDVAEYLNIYTGNSLTANGHYIYPIFSKNRTSVSGVTGLTTETITQRFSTVAGYASRVFYSGANNTAKGLGSRIYFSRLILDNFEDIGRCYQQNDPTSEEFSDLLDTDGGFISIPEATIIRKLHVFGPTLYVFADNGVWSISGVDDVFRASEYSVSKITDVGLRYKQSFVSAEGRPYWWSTHGIHTLVLNDQIGSIVEQNISTPTIRSFWNELDSGQKNSAVGVYDGFNNRVVWMYKNPDVTAESVYNRFLIFDEVFSAFYPWYVSVSASDYIIGAIWDPRVVDSDESSSGLKYFVKDKTTNEATFADFTNTSFYDFEDDNYSSYAIAGYDFAGDLTIQKNAPYVTVFLERTEEGFTGNSTDGYEAIRPSSCLVSAYWDFNTQESSTQQAYRLKFPVVVNATDLSVFDYPSTVISTRLKVRGRGRSFNLKFQSEEGKDMHLYGFEVVVARNPTF